MIYRAFSTIIFTLTIGVSLPLPPSQATTTPLENYTLQHETFTLCEMFTKKAWDLFQYAVNYFSHNIFYRRDFSHFIKKWIRDLENISSNGKFYYLKKCIYAIMYMMSRIDENASSGNLTVVQGETVMLVCTVLNLGDKSVRK